MISRFGIPAERLRHWDRAKKAYVVVDPGKYELQIRRFRRY